MANIIVNLTDIFTEKKKTALYKYRDIEMPITVKMITSPSDSTYETVSVNDLKDIQAIRASIANIFDWRQGMRILDPLFGNIIYRYVYEPLNDLTIKNLKADVLRMLEYEPRINVKQIDANSVKDHELLINILYQIPSLDITQSDTIVVTK